MNRNKQHTAVVNRNIAMILRGGCSHLGQIIPVQRCRKCASNAWYADIEPLTWYCPICGNRIYYTYGVLRQQIDIIMQSQRGREFVHSEDGKCIIPKKNELIKKLKIRKVMAERVAERKMRRARAKLRGEELEDPDNG